MIFLLLMLLKVVDLVYQIFYHSYYCLYHMVSNHIKALYIPSFFSRKKTQNNIQLFSRSIATLLIKQNLLIKKIERKKKEKRHSYVFFCSVCVKNDKRRRRKKTFLFLCVGKATACFNHIININEKMKKKKAVYAHWYICSKTNRTGREL